MNVKTSTHIQKNVSTGEIHCKSKQSEIFIDALSVLFNELHSEK